jgi:hypothetical protein
MNYNLTNILAKIHFQSFFDGKKSEIFHFFNNYLRISKNSINFVQNVFISLIYLTNFFWRGKTRLFWFMDLIGCRLKSVKKIQMD